MSGGIGRRTEVKFVGLTDITSVFLNLTSLDLC